MGLRKKHVWNWDFMILNPTDYKVLVDLDISGELFYNAFYKAKKKYKIDNPHVNLENVYEFEAPKTYLNVLRAGTKMLLKQCFQEVGEDGIKIITTELQKAVYKKVDTKWRIFLTYTGTYVKN